MNQKTMPPEDEWNSLDSAARANLDAVRQQEYFRYRDQLRAEGLKWADDAEVILTGFIWNEIEDQEQSDDDPDFLR